jgi:hypothetical protein
MIISRSDPVWFLMRATLGDTTDNSGIRPGQDGRNPFADARVPSTDREEIR